MVARVRRQSHASSLDAYRAASGPVFALFEQAEQRREHNAAQRVDPWTVPAATRAECVCAWNAFALQVLGNCLADANARTRAGARGFVPRGTAEQVRAFYEPVEGWSDRTHFARADPSYTIDVPLPAPLPRWSEDTRRSPAHLAGLRHAMRSLIGHAAAALELLPAAADGEARTQVLARIRTAYAAAESRARIAEELCGAGPVPPAHAFAEAYVRDAIERFSLLGQVIADPALAEQADVTVHRPLDLGAGQRKVIKPSRGRRRRLGAKERTLLQVASDPRHPFPQRHEAVIAMCRGRTPIGELVELYDWLDVGALREIFVFGLLSRPEAEAVQMMARIAREDPDAQVRHVALLWLRTSRHKDAARLATQLRIG